MLNLNSLRQAVTDERAEAANKQVLADKLLSDADTHEANGDEVQAQRERQSAERYIRDVADHNAEVAKYEAEIQDRERKLADVDKRIEELTARFDHDFDRLQSDRKSAERQRLVSAGAGENVTLVTSQLKVTNVDKQVESLEKQFKQDLERLEHEKSLYA